MLVFILFILSKIWLALLLGMILGLFAWWLGWSRKLRIYVASLSVTLALSLLFPIVVAGLYLLLLGGIMAWVKGLPIKTALQDWLKGWLLVFLGMGVLIVPYLMITVGASSYAYGYGEFNHEGQTYIVVYEREDYEFLRFVHTVPLTEHLYSELSLLSLGQRDSHLALEFGEKNPGISFVLPTTEEDKADYLKSFD